MAEKALVPASATESKANCNLLDQLAHTESIRKLLECPICLELPLPPIYVCQKGHIVCTACQSRTHSCPLCKGPYSSTTRGFVAEGLIENCMLKCKNTDSGCPLTLRGSALVDHLEVCDYRPVKCVDCGGKMVNFDEYEDHLLKFHKISGVNLCRAYVIYSMNLAQQIEFGEKCCWPQYYMKAFDNVTFLLRLYATHWFVCAWISLLGAKNDCSKYEALVEFHPTGDDSVISTWSGPVNHFRDDAKQIFLQGRGLITPLETLMQIAPVANDHAEWIYNVEILPVTPPTPVANDSIDVDELETAEKKLDVSEENGGGIPTPNDGGDAPRASASPRVPAPEERRVSRVGSPLRITSATPRFGSSQCPALRSPRVTSSSGTRLQTSRNTTASYSNNFNSRSPAPSTSSTSLLAAATSIANSLMENIQGPPSSSQQPQPFRSNSSRGRGRSSGAPRPDPMMLNIRRGNTHPFSFLFRGTSPTSRAYGFLQDEWDFTSASASDEE